jgi:hypothetical protein
MGTFVSAYTDDFWNGADGRWLTYTSFESQRPEIYAVPYSGPGGKVQISRMPARDTIG